MKSIFIDTWVGSTFSTVRKAITSKSASFIISYGAIKPKLSRRITYLDEVYTLLFKRLPADFALKAVEAISDAIDNGYLDLVWMIPGRFVAAQKLRLKFQDKPDISFTDLTSMVVMQELGISNIITGDGHFTHVGMEFVLHP